ncbi:hypothetical protein VTN00DRAFT_3418 [Thermoascus crustaceus]|uniref:uncharacterized protein n=1 Tax=Thermoascus crustaceus TaxID=5088 RepID=UPI003743A576
MVTSMDLAGILPTIKCSNCGTEVEISAMGDHVCSKPAPALPASPPPDQEQHRLSPGKPDLPRIDPFAANRPFLRPEPLTPASSNGSRSVSPLSPFSGTKSPYPAPQKRLPAEPPSPELSTLDLFPMPGKSRPHANSNATDKMLPPAPAPPAPPPPPKDDVLSPGHRRTDTRSSTASSISRPSTANSMRRPSTASSHRPRNVMDEVPPVPMGPLRSFTPAPRNGTRDSSVSGSPPKRTENYLGFDFGLTAEPKSYDDDDDDDGSRALDPSGTLQRSQTLPAKNGNRDSFESTKESLMRRPSQPAEYSRSRRPTLEDLDLPPIPAPEASSTPKEESYRPLSAETSAAGDAAIPPRIDSLVAPKPSGEGERTSTSDKRKGFDGGGLSVSNFARALDLDAADSSDESPVSSPRLSPTRIQSGSSMSSPPSELRGPDSAEENTLHSKGDVPAAADANGEAADQSTMAPPCIPYLNSPDSPTDPALQQGRVSLVQDKPAEQPPENTAPEHSAHQRTLTRSDIEPSTPRLAAPPRKHCRGCGEPIVGKSVSSADGRLTGRYHKACFVCYTCGSPFQTADFYVWKDRPYCAQHYHELNGSLCAGCQTGIEGQYLETNERAGRGAADRQKFHPDCLRCYACRIVLKGDYFEWNGRVYCERDARRAAMSTPPPGWGRRPPMPSPLAHGYGPPGPPGPGPRGPRGPPGPPGRPGPRRGPPPPGYGPGPDYGPGPGPGPGPGGYLGPPPGPRRFPERRTTRLMMA